VFAPGFDFGAVPRNASGGTSNILFNGRDLSQVEVTTVLGLFGLPSSSAAQYAGSYNLDQSGNLSDASGQYLGNLVQLAKAQNKTTTSSGGSDGFWSTSSGVRGNTGCGGYISFPNSSSSGSTSVDTGNSGC
jgi:hypothetical protein